MSEDVRVMPALEPPDERGIRHPIPGKFVRVAKWVREWRDESELPRSDPRRGINERILAAIREGR